MALSLPTPRSLESGDDFDKWIKSIEIYMSAMNITRDAQKRSIVLHLLGSQTQEIYENLPSEEAESYAVLKAKLSHYYKPTTNPVVERHVFSRLKYEHGSVSKYVVLIRSQAAKCNYSAEEVEMQIRDKLVSTCPLMKVKERMLREDSLDLNKAMKIWSAEEHIRKQTMKMQDDDGEDKKICKVQNKFKFNEKSKGIYKSNKRYKSDEEYENKRKCYRCGLSNHLIRECRVPKDIRCNKCKKKGHMKAACGENDKHYNKINAVDLNEDEDNDNNDATCVYNVLKNNKAIKIDVEINRVPVSFILDTGCPVTMISEVTAKKLNLNLQQTNENLTSYTGHKIQCLGKADVDVLYEQQRYSLPLLIVAGKAPSLLGRTWLQHLKIDWTSIVASVTDNNFTLQSVLEENATVFENSLGQMTNRKAKLRIKNDAVPVFENARQLP